MYDKANWQWVDPKTKSTYDLRHMQGFITPFEVKLSKSAPITSINAKISFSNHCFSRTRTDDNENNQVISQETKRDGTIEERVFCTSRWEFSKKLPSIIKDLAYKNCLEGGSREILYRQEDHSNPGQHDGWYICMRLDYKRNRNPQLEIWVRSAHWRPNRPVDIRSHGGKRFCMLLSEYLKSKGRA